MAQHKAAESALVTAARALDRELEELAQKTDHIKRAPLTTQRQIERVRELLASIVPAEESVRARLAALERAIQAANAKRAEQTAAVAERTPHIDARAAELQRLLDRYIDLGLRTTQAQGGLADASAVAALVAMASETDALLAAAKNGDFPDIVRLAEALGKQLALTLAKRRAP